MATDRLPLSPTTTNKQKTTVLSVQYATFSSVPHVEKDKYIHRPVAQLFVILPDGSLGPSSSFFSHGAIEIHHLIHNKLFLQLLSLFPTRLIFILQLREEEEIRHCDLDP